MFKLENVSHELFIFPVAYVSITVRLVEVVHAFHISVNLNGAWVHCQTVP